MIPLVMKTPIKWSLCKCKALVHCRKFIYTTWHRV